MQADKQAADKHVVGKNGNRKSSDKMPAEESLSYADGKLTLAKQIGDWSKWSKQLKARNKVVALRKLLDRNYLLWGLPSSDAIHCPTIARLVQLKPSTKNDDGFDWGEAAGEWMSSVKEVGIDVESGLQALAWAQAMPTLCNRLLEEQWLELLASLLYVAQPKHSRSVQSRFASFLLQTDLAITLSYSLPEISLCKKLAASARQQFENGIDEMLDGEGMPHAAHLSSIQLLLASATRTLTIDETLKKGRISKAARLQFDWLCRQTLRWARSNGSPILNDARADSPHFDEMMKSAFRLTEDGSDLAAYKLLRGKRKSPEEDPPAEAEHSEWSEVATMRTNWTPAAARIAVSFSERTLRSELSIGQEVVFQGTCNPSIVIDGRELDFESDWEEVCWETDDDMDFIEVDCKLTDGWRIQRQLLLARQDKFALIADAFIGPSTSKIQYKHRLPLADGVTLEQSSENTEALILGEKRLGTVIPLSLSEWKTGDSGSRLRTDPAGLEIKQRARGLYAPLFIDFDSSRKNKPLTWRSLTVAESLQTVAKDVAVAFRVQIGKEQWAIYRSLAKPGNRTFLGQNLTSEFVVSRFLTDGEVEPIVDVSV